LVITLISFRRHGPITHCAIAQYEALAKEFIEAPEGSSKRVELELRFGKVNIRRLVANYQEEQANLELLKSSTTICPGCQCHVEKMTGCNHVGPDCDPLRFNLTIRICADDVLEMPAAFLLSMWAEAECEYALRPLFSARNELLQSIVRC